MTAPLLGLLGLVLSVAVPRWLSAARWPPRAPAAAVFLWQAVTLASVLSAVGVVLAAPEQIVRASDAGRGLSVTVLIATLAVAALIVLRLLVSLVLVMRRSRQRRERHRLLVDLLDRAEHHGDQPGLPEVTELRVLDGDLPFAYCLPGRSPRVVVSGGALRVLAPEQVTAVLAHEQAHLRSRHDLVLESFVALYRALPVRLRSRRSLDAVRLLLEMLADDAARKQPLREALTTLGAAATRSEPGTQQESRDPEKERRARLARLAEAALPPSPMIGLLAVVTAVAVLVLPTVVVVVPWLSRALPVMPL